MSPEPPPPAPDLFLGGRLGLRQPARGHRSGTDAVLLAAAIPADAGGDLVDFGAGVGAAGLASAARCPGLNVALVEIAPELAGFAEANIRDNAFGARARVIRCDALSAADRARAGLADNSADFAIANPPWLTPGRHRASPDAARALAHVARPGEGPDAGVDGWLRAMAAVLRPGGRMTMIHRADSLGDILRACGGRFGGVVVLPIYPRAGEAAIRVLVAGAKGARAPLKILPGLALHGDDGAFTPMAEAIHRGEAGVELS